MVRIYKSRKKRIRKRTTRKNKVFRKKKRHTKKRHTKRINRKRNNRKRRTKKGGSVRRRNPAAPGTIRVANKWVAGRYGHWIGTPHFINWGIPGGRQSGSTSIAVRFLNLDNGGLDNGRVHLYGTALPIQTHPSPVLDPATGLFGATDPRDPANWAGPVGHPVASRMYRQMAYFMYAKGVKKWITHQGCSSNRSFPGHYFHDPTGDMVSCQGNPGTPGSPMALGQRTAANAWTTNAQKINAANAQDNTWRAVRIRYPLGRPMEPHAPGIAIDPAWRRLENATIRDMTAGRMQTWHRINQHVNFHDPNNSTVIHCLAGWGRTGATLFFYIFRNWFSIAPLAAKRRINQQYLGVGPAPAGGVDWRSRNMYDHMRRLANRSLRHDDMHNDNGTVEGVLPARVTIAHPIDRFPNAENGALPAGRGPNGDWERPLPLTRTSDLVHEVFALRGRGGNVCSDIFISRINIIIVNIWIYLYLTDYPGSIPVAQRAADWNRVYLYRKPSAPAGAGGAVGWPAGTAWDRCSPRDIFGPVTVGAGAAAVTRDPMEPVMMSRVCAHLGLAIGGMGGHLTKAIQPIAAANLMPIATWDTVFGLDFSP